MEIFPGKATHPGDSLAPPPPRAARLWQLGLNFRLIDEKALERTTRIQEVLICMSYQEAGCYLFVIITLSVPERATDSNFNISSITA
jgi:hypothetical protein